ncbi:MULTISPECIES: EF-hand domain-containing protein [Sphingomonas]|jgi:Ca2+-binding EF-hand superfamily protein|uniref:EF-hand domain-containing protein n=1 Tax=Sphingomonas zeae TaxID=1646122 RepID=A0A7Y6B8B5_9SPHN|nr:MULTISPECIES: EF-hand domain-containing protein [Sphingomonas]MBB4046840.1 Ca2+-binding EF-hand superfamily protein [Sphingomonas zeae]MDK8184613.1 EF-hand domain-containing protein [Sphingomonas zeae]MDK8214298.1 EF-hand domain-containing protein [Sphingomonas sp. UMB7805-LC452B]NUU48945.1 EF-hand domain-containing protein [Sphingomonas zeae]
MILLALLLMQATPPADQGADNTVVVTARPKPFAQTPATMVVEPVAMMIATLDSDGDGKTTRAEMEAGVKRSYDAIDTAHQGSIGYLQFADWAERWLGDRNALPSPFDVDKDGDNRITLAELQAHFSRLFSRFDRDHDGAISRPEALTIRTIPADANGPTGPLRPRDRK